MSKKVQKEPGFTDSWWLGTRTLIIKREGILIPLEKELLGRGYENTLGKELSDINQR